MTLLNASPQRQRNHKLHRRVFRRFVEFQGISRFTSKQNRSHVKQIYDGPAGAVLALSSLVSLHEPLVGRVMRKGKFDVTRFKNILDVGSGAGQILGHLIKETSPETKLVACDLSHQMLKRAQNRLKSQRPDFMAADLTQLPFSDATFDCVTCGYVLEYLPDPTPGLEELGRVLMPGGSLFLLATEDTISGAMNSRTWKCRTYNREEMQEICEQCGLPWREQLWLTPVHKFFKLGGILVEAVKPVE